MRQSKQTDRKRASSLFIPFSYPPNPPHPSPPVCSLVDAQASPVSLFGMVFCFVTSAAITAATAIIANQQTIMGRPNRSPPVGCISKNYKMGVINKIIIFFSPEHRRKRSVGMYESEPRAKKSELVRVRPRESKRERESRWKRAGR